MGVTNVVRWLVLLPFLRYAFCLTLVLNRNPTVFPLTDTVGWLLLLRLTAAQAVNPSCPGVSKDVDGACCPAVIMDNNGRCCPSGQLDACGVCGGYSLLVDIQGAHTCVLNLGDVPVERVDLTQGHLLTGTCCKSDVTDAAGVCCEPGKVLDVCGVCDGDASTCVVGSSVEYQVNVTDQNSIITGLAPHTLTVTKSSQNPLFIIHLISPPLLTLFTLGGAHRTNLDCVPQLHGRLSWLHGKRAGPSPSGCASYGRDRGRHTKLPSAAPAGSANAASGERRFSRARNAHPRPPRLYRVSEKN